MEAWKRRLEELFRKEARCPACAKAKRVKGDTNLPEVCEAHMRIRREMAFGTYRL